MDSAGNGTPTGLADRVELLEDALHQTRQRCDLLLHAVGEMARLNAGRGLDVAELIESLHLHGAPASSLLVGGAGLLEPDHPEANEPQVLPHTLGVDVDVCRSALASKARLAGARFAFHGEDVLADVRSEETR